MNREVVNRLDFPVMTFRTGGNEVLAFSRKYDRGSCMFPAFVDAPIICRGSNARRSIG